MDNHESCPGLGRRSYIGEHMWCGVMPRLWTGGGLCVSRLLHQWGAGKEDGALHVPQAWGPLWASQGLGTVSRAMNVAAA